MLGIKPLALKIVVVTSGVVCWWVADSLPASVCPWCVLAIYLFDVESVLSLTQGVAANA
ncbi:MAG TPA: hypothetical protein ACQGQH_00935 [Xylella sp.]